MWLLIVVAFRFVFADCILLMRGLCFVLLMFRCCFDFALLFACLFGFGCLSIYVVFALLLFLGCLFYRCILTDG